MAINLTVFNFRKFARDVDVQQKSSILAEEPDRAAMSA